MPKYIAIILVILSTFFWGANFNVGKYVVGEMSPMIATALRFSIASLLIIIIVVIKERNFYKMLKSNLKIYILLGLVGVAGFNGLFLLGLKFSSAINCALIMSTNPLVTTLLASFILKNPIQLYQKIGMTLSLVGVTIVLTQGSMDTLLHLQIALGDWIIIIGNICWALYGVLSIRYLKNTSPLVTTASTMFFGTIVLIILAIFEGSTAQILNQSWSIYGAVFYMAAFGAVLAYLFWNIGISCMGASQTAIFFNLVPMFTVLISMVMGHPIHQLQIVGGSVIILGVLVSSNLIKNPLKLKVKS